jgi:hypothetical protein
MLEFVLNFCSGMKDSIYWHFKTAMIYYLIPFFGVLYIFLNQAIVLTQVISMGIIIY